MPSDPRVTGSVLSWSDAPGPIERHLRLRQGNLLFPRQRRSVCAADVEQARAADIAVLASLLERYRSVQRHQLRLGDYAPLRESYLLLKQYDDLSPLFLLQATPEALRWHASLSTIVAALSAIILVALKGDAAAARAFNAWRDKERAVTDQHRDRVFVILTNAPLDEFGPTLCSLEPDEIASVLAQMPPAIASGIRDACAVTFDEAVLAGYPREAADARLRAVRRGVQ